MEGKKLVKADEGDFVKIRIWGHVWFYEIFRIVSDTTDYHSYKDSESHYLIEFYDRGGNYHYWKQEYDGGVLVKKGDAQEAMR